MSITAACDLRQLFGSIRDQGSRLTCLAFATSDIHAVARGPYAALSVEHLYYHAVQRTPGADPNQGVGMRATIDALRLDGQALESGWPYLSSLPANLSTWKPPAGAAPVYTKAATSSAWALSRIISMLDLGKPVVVTLLLSEAFYVPRDGIVEKQPRDKDTDWHAVIAVGHGELGGRKYVLVRNSWGDGWSRGGYGWLASDYLTARLGDSAMIS